MRGLFLIAFTLASSLAAAQATPPASPPNPSDVTVQGPERLVCRRVARTATRMRTARVCRRVSEWMVENGGRSQDELLAEAADSLEVLGEKISTNAGRSTTGGPGPY